MNRKVAITISLSVLVIEIIMVYFCAILSIYSPWYIILGIVGIVGVALHPKGKIFERER